MSHIDPKFGPDFRPGHRGRQYQIKPPVQDLDVGEFQPDFSTFLTLDQDAPADDYLEYEKTRAARGIINGIGLSMIAWAFIIAVILLVWGV